ncbi:hypothetical protein cypCar_00045987 [Cyprinus carpio]|nr:hypothetical protein cypCar_00045987 [Cyprinus carpio]
MFDMFIFFFLFSWSLAGVFGGDAVKSESVTEGESVTLNTDVNTINEIQWSFIHNNNKILIALINRQNEKKIFYEDALDERFKGRLKLDQTGSLIITNTRTTDSGLYLVTGGQTEKPLDKFNLTVYVQTREITYADPTFNKRHKSRVKEQDNVVYAGVVRH